MGLAQYEAERLDEAAATLGKGTILQPDNRPCLAYLAATQARLGQMDAARRSAERLLEVNPATSIAWLRATIPYRDPTRRDRFLADMAASGVPQ